MSRDAVSDAIAGMSRRELEDLVERAGKALQSCTVCGAEHADACRITRRGVVASLLLCPACFEKHRLPEGRSEEMA